MIKRGKSKKAQQVFGMSFSFIISILLIAVFIAVAFFAIKHFLNIKKCNEIGFFIDDLEAEIDSAWKSQASEKTFSRNLPSGIEYVCFADLNEGQIGPRRDVYSELMKDADFTANLFFYPPKKACVEATDISHINMTEIIKTENPYCIPVENNKARMRIEKGFDEQLIRISRAT